MDYIYTKQNSISRELCNKIISMYESQNGKYEGVTACGLNKDVKDTTDFIIPKTCDKWSKIDDFLQRELTTNVRTYINNITTNITNGINNYADHVKSQVFQYSIFSTDRLSLDTILIQRYYKGKGKYIKHHDFAIKWDEKKHRVVTFLWYLNDVTDGGETEFWHNHKITPEAGKLILFPACWSFPHAGLMPISHDKYIITGWLYLSGDNI
jgi:Rps23 Pro-64 3,4-dihydroxylase Tpa1-like proline 4-hydroxylase